MFILLILFPFTNFSIFQKSQPPMASKPEIVKVGLFFDPIYASECFVKNYTKCQKPGLEIEIFLSLMKMLGWNYRLIFTEKGDYGDLINGTWSGLVGGLVKTELDMTALTMRVTEKRNEFIDFSYPISFYDQIYLIAKPTQTDSLDVIVRPFSAGYWHLVAFLLVLISFLTWFHASVKKIGPNGEIFNLRLLQSSIFNSYATLVKQPIPKFWQNHKTFHVTAWSFLTFYWIHLYESVLSSMLIVPLPAKIPFLTLKEILDKMEPNSWHFTNFRNVTPGCALSQCDYLHRKLDQVPMNIVKSAAQLSYDVIYQKGIYPAIDDGDFYESHVNLWGTTPYAAIRDDTVPQSWVAFAFSKKFPREYRQQFDAAIIAMMPGFLPIKGRYIRRQRAFVQKASAKLITLQVKHLLEAFVLISGGQILALLMLFVEIYCHKSTRPDLIVREIVRNCLSLARKPLHEKETDEVA